jgi:hypothetical protein
LIGWRNNVV